MEFKSVGMIIHSQLNGNSGKKQTTKFFTFEADQNKKQKTECSPQHEAWLVQHRLHLLVSRNMKDSQVRQSRYSNRSNTNKNRVSDVSDV